MGHMNTTPTPGTTVTVTADPENPGFFTGTATVAFRLPLFDENAERLVVRTSEDRLFTVWTRNTVPTS